MKRNRPGRPRAADPRDVRIQLRLSSAEAKMLDDLRGAMGRPAFLRALMSKHAHEKGQS